MEIEITDLQFHKFAIILDNVFTKEECDSLHLFTFQMPIFNKPHKYLFLGFYYSVFYFICEWL
jgi:hypothetical protein